MPVWILSTYSDIYRVGMIEIQYLPQRRILGDILVFLFVFLVRKIHYMLPNLHIYPREDFYPRKDLNFKFLNGYVFLLLAVTLNLV